MNLWLRYSLVVALLLGASAIVRRRGQAENLPPNGTLTSFPLRVGGWEGSEVSLSPDVREVLGDGEFLERIYFRAPNEPAIDLFLAYFPSQRTGSTIHSPQNCLPGSGWVPVESRRIRVTRPSSGSITVNRYVLTRGPQRLLVLYWYQAHGRVVTSEYWAKFYLVTDAIRMNRTDGSLVRVATSLDSMESVETGEKRAVQFTQTILPRLDRCIPR